MRVSIVAVPCRKLAHAARWKGNAPQVTTGAARVSDSHCHASNCNAGTIASSTTGSDNAPEMNRRWRRARVGSAAASTVAADAATPGGR